MVAPETWLSGLLGACSTALDSQAPNVCWLCWRRLASSNTLSVMHRIFALLSTWHLTDLALSCEPQHLSAVSDFTRPLAPRFRTHQKMHQFGRGSLSAA
jgi:hypothetical protein